MKRKIVTDSSEMSTIEAIDSKGIPYQLASQHRDAMVITLDVLMSLLIIRSKKSSKDRDNVEVIEMSTRVLEENGGKKMGNSRVPVLVLLLRS